MAEREPRQSPTAAAADENLLVCVGEASATSALIRYAQRAADGLPAPWTAIYIETARAGRLNDAERDRIVEHLRLAERLGASTITIPGGNIADEILAYAEANNITRIIVGRSARPRRFGILHRPVSRRLVRKAARISIH